MTIVARDSIVAALDPYIDHGMWSDDLRLTMQTHVLAAPSIFADYLREVLPDWTAAYTGQVYRFGLEDDLCERIRGRLAALERDGYFWYNYQNELWEFFPPNLVNDLTLGPTYVNVSLFSEPYANIQFPATYQPYRGWSFRESHGTY